MSNLLIFCHSLCEGKTPLPWDLFVSLSDRDKHVAQYLFSCTKNIDVIKDVSKNMTSWTWGREFLDQLVEINDCQTIIDCLFAQSPPHIDYFFSVVEHVSWSPLDRSTLLNDILIHPQTQIFLDPSNRIRPDRLIPNSLEQIILHTIIRKRYQNIKPLDEVYSVSDEERLSVLKYLLKSQGLSFVDDLVNDHYTPYRDLLEEACEQIGYILPPKTQSYLLKQQLKPSLDLAPCEETKKI